VPARKNGYSPFSDVASATLKKVVPVDEPHEQRAMLKGLPLMGDWGLKKARAEERPEGEESPEDIALAEERLAK
jgi:hypothetical protein